MFLPNTVPHAMGSRLLKVFAPALLVAALSAPAALSSQLIARNARDVRLQVNRSGIALLRYRANGQARHVLAWGAVDARPSSSTLPQVRFRLDYSGGWSSRRAEWRTFHNACTPTSVRLRWLVTACVARDGSLWALQSWRRGLPNYGLPATPQRGARELRLSHWTGALPRLEVGFGWTYGRFQQIYGRLTYRGLPVYGSLATRRGRPLDGYGRNVYVDTFNSEYGIGWHRENAFLTHRGTGGFCYGFYPHSDRTSGRGQRYRATVIGPGVTPDIYWEGAAPVRYNRESDLRADVDLLALLRDDGVCRPR